MKASSLKAQMRAIKEHQKRRHVYQQLEARRTHSFRQPGNNQYLTNLKRRNTTKSSKARKRPKRARAPRPDELPTTNDSEAEGKVSTPGAESQSAALEPSRTGSKSQADSEGAKETEGRSLEMERGSPQTIEESPREVSGTKPEATADVRGRCAAEAPCNQEHSPIEAISAVEVIEDVSPVSSIETKTKTRLNEDMQSSQFVRSSQNRAISEESEAPQTETKAMSQELGTLCSPIIISDYDSDEGMDTEGEDEVDEPSGNMIVDGNEGQLITNYDSEGDVDAEGEDDDELLGNAIVDGNEGQPITYYDDPEEDIEDEDGVDDNEGQPITTDHSEEGMDPGVGDEDGDKVDDATYIESSSDAKRSPPRRCLTLHGLVDWTSPEHKEETEKMLRIAWAKVIVQWMKACRYESLHEIRRFRAFEKKMRRALNNGLLPDQARQLCSSWKRQEKRLLRKPQAKPHKERLREFGQSLELWEEAEFERQSIAVAMGDGDKNDHDYVPGRRRRRNR